MSNGAAALDVTSRNGCYGTTKIMEMEERELRAAVLRFTGTLAPEGASRDKLCDLAGYAYEMARFRARGVQPQPEFLRRAQWALDPRRPALSSMFRDRAARASRAFDKMKEKGPSPGSAQAMAYALLDKNPEWNGNALFAEMMRAGRPVALNSARSHVSCWRRAQREAKDK